MKSVGEKIKQLRKSKGLSLKELAQKLDVSDTSLSKIETGKVDSIKIDTGKKISDELGVSFNELFEINSLEEKNEEEIRQLEKRISELESQVQDKDELVKIYRDTTQFLDLFVKFFIKEFKHIDKYADGTIPLEDMYERIEKQIKKEMGDDLEYYKREKVYLSQARDIAKKNKM